MKRGLCIILLACMLLTACAGKGATKTEPVPHKNIYSKEECTVNYESAISKCAGAPGTEYEAYKFVDDDLEYIHSEKEWVDENGHLRIPFSVDDSLNGHVFSSFYIQTASLEKQVRKILWKSIVNLQLLQDGEEVISSSTLQNR